MLGCGTASKVLAVLLPLAACAGPGVLPPLRPVSMLGLRFEATVPQRFDYTCGASSVATVLTFYWDRPTSEADAVAALERRYSAEEVARRRDTGLSFDDLIFMVERLGFAAQGATVPVAQLGRLRGPVVVQLSDPSFEHFVVLRRVGDGVFYLSDPIVGNYPMDAARFEREFTGHALAIWRPGGSLPRDAPLTRPRDGLSVTNSLERVLDAPPPVSNPIL